MDYGKNLYTLIALVRGIQTVSIFTTLSPQDSEFVRQELEYLENLKKEMGDSPSTEGTNVMFSHLPPPPMAFNPSTFSQPAVREDVRVYSPRNEMNSLDQHDDHENNNDDEKKKKKKNASSSCCCSSLCCCIGTLVWIGLSLLLAVLLLGGNLARDMTPQDLLTTQFWTSSYENTLEVVQEKLCEVGLW